MEIQRVLLTGGTGFLGAHLLYDLIDRGYQVRALKRHGSTTRWVKKIFSYRGDPDALLFRSIDWVEGDVLDYESLVLHLEGMDALVHAAAIVSFNPQKRSRMIFENRNAAANVADACLALNIKRLCHISSVAALGKAPAGAAVDETCVLSSFEGKNAYGQAKYLAEMEIRRAMEMGVQTVILNPAVILGPGHWQAGSPKFFRYIARRTPFYTLGGEGFVDVRDVSAVVLESLSNSKLIGESFVLSAQNASYKDLFSEMASALHVRAPFLLPPKFLMGILAFVMEQFSLLVGKEPAISRDSIASAKRQSRYDGTKIEKFTPFRYRPLQETIRYTAECYLRDPS